MWAGIRSHTSSNNNTIMVNYVINNRLGGLSLSTADDNLIYNNFFNNSENFYSYGLNQKSYGTFRIQPE